LIGVGFEDAKLISGIWQLAGSQATLRLTCYWHVLNMFEGKPIPWRLVDERGNVLVTYQQLPRFAAGYPEAWIPNEIVEDHYDIPLGGVPRDTLTLQVADEKLVYTSIATLMFADNSPTTAQVPIEKRMSARVGDSLQFLGYDIALPPQPGTAIPITLYWKTDRSIPEDLTGFIHLLDGQGEVVTQQDGLTDDGFFPTTLWMPGSTIPDRRDLRIPASIKPGLYHLIAGLYRFENLERLQVTNEQGIHSLDDVVELGEIKVPMNAQGVRPSHPLDVSLGSSIQLLGYDMQISRDQVKLVLYWKTREKMDTDYKVFVHVIDASGNLVAQIDRFPGEDRYPTHIWGVNEEIVDSYGLSLPNPQAGRYTIAVGMYASESGERLFATEGGGNALADRQIVIELDKPGR
jgi:hypothetical protein